MALASLKGSSLPKLRLRPPKKFSVELALPLRSRCASRSSSRSSMPTSVRKSGCELSRGLGSCVTAGPVVSCALLVRRPNFLPTPANQPLTRSPVVVSAPMMPELERLCVLAMSMNCEVPRSRFTEGAVRFRMWPRIFLKFWPRAALTFSVTGVGPMLPRVIT